LAPNEPAREAVVRAYIRLCDFPEGLSNDEWAAADVMRRIFTGETAARRELTQEIGETYRRLTQRQAAEAQHLASEMKGAIPAAGIVDSYADFLSKRSNAGGMVRDASILPYPREVIREAILCVLNGEHDPQLRRFLKGVYVALASFQALTLEEREANNLFDELTLRDPPLEEAKVHAVRLGAVMASLDAVRHRFESDMKVFATDMAKIP
jgi:hypothetical protein